MPVLIVWLPFRETRFPELERKMYQWLCAWPQDRPILDADIRTQALNLAKFMGIPDHKFKASDGWIENFKRRNGVKNGRYIPGDGEDDAKLKAHGYRSIYQSLPEQEAEAAAMAEAQAQAKAEAERKLMEEPEGDIPANHPLLNEEAVRLAHDPNHSPDMRRKAWIAAQPNRYGADDDAIPDPYPYVIDDFSDDEDPRSSQASAHTGVRSTHRHPNSIPFVSTADDDASREPNPRGRIVPCPMPRLPTQPSLSNPPLAPDGSGKRIYVRRKRGAIIPREPSTCPSADVAEEYMFQVVWFCRMQNEGFISEEQLFWMDEVWQALRELKQGTRMPMENYHEKTQEWRRKLLKQKQEERKVQNAAASS